MIGDGEAAGTPNLSLPGDLQRLVDRAFEGGGYAALEVTRDPEPPLAAEDARRLDRCLREAGLRR